MSAAGRAAVQGATKVASVSDSRILQKLRGSAGQLFQAPGAAGGEPPLPPGAPPDARRSSARGSLAPAVHTEGEQVTEPENVAVARGEAQEGGLGEPPPGPRTGPTRPGLLVEELATMGRREQLLDV